MTKTRKIMIVAGEASGDGHSAKLVRALVEAESETKFDFFGAAGPKMREVGVKPVVLADELSIVGVVEIAGALPMFLAAFRDLKKAARMRKPDAVVLVDFPEFNLKLAKALKKQGFTIIYYISPQLWAWRKYRVSTIRKYVDLLLTILPFENEWYEQQGVENVVYVGSPLANEVHSTKSKEDFCRENRLDSSKPIISLLPGSRNKEIARILPLMIESSNRISDDVSDVQFIIAIGSSKHSELVKRCIEMSEIGGGGEPSVFTIIENETYNALMASDAAAVTSGTATLETGIIGTPLVIVYKTSTLNYVLLKPLISVEHYGLINLIAGERVAKEMVQNDLTAETLSRELRRLLQPDENADMRKRLRIATDRLGSGGASKRAAKAILDLLAEKQ